MKRCGLLRQELGRAAAAVLQLHREAGAGPEAGDRRRPEGDHRGLGDLLGERPVQRGDDPVRRASSAVVRSSQGLSWTKKKPMFEE